MSTPGFRVERLKDKKIGKIVLSRPEKHNIIEVPERAMIRHAFEELDADPDVRVIIMQGEGGRAFCSGGNIPGFMEYSPLEMSEFADNAAAPERCSKPVIAAVDGYAMGVGLEFALACDFIIATKRSGFAFPEIRLGVIPGSGGTQRVLRLIGIFRTKDFIMRGRRMSAEEAAAAGMITRCVEVDELDKTVMELAAELAKSAPAALRVLKRLLNKGLDCSLPTALEFEGRAFATLLSTRDWQEGVKAWTEKREPQFEGR